MGYPVVVPFLPAEYTLEMSGWWLTNLVLSKGPFLVSIWVNYELTQCQPHPKMDLMIWISSTKHSVLLLGLRLYDFPQQIPWINIIHADPSVLDRLFTCLFLCPDPEIFEDPPSLLKFHKPFDVISSMYEKNRKVRSSGHQSDLKIDSNHRPS